MCARCPFTKAQARGAQSRCTCARSGVDLGRRMAGRGPRAGGGGAGGEGLVLVLRRGGGGVGGEARVRGGVGEAAEPGVEAHDVARDALDLHANGGNASCPRVRTAGSWSGVTAARLDHGRGGRRDRQGGRGRAADMMASVRSGRIPPSFPNAPIPHAPIRAGVRMREPPCVRVRVRVRGDRGGGELRGGECGADCGEVLGGHGGSVEGREALQEGIGVAEQPGRGRGIRKGPRRVPCCLVPRSFILSCLPSTSEPGRCGQATAAAVLVVSNKQRTGCSEGGMEGGAGGGEARGALAGVGPADGLVEEEAHLQHKGVDHASCVTVIRVVTPTPIPLTRSGSCQLHPPPSRRPTFCNPPSHSHSALPRQRTRSMICPTTAGG